MKPQWEYNIAKISGGGNNGLVTALNTLGAEGWEAWHYVDGPDGGTAFIKRLRPQVADFSISKELQRKLNGGR